MLIATSVVMETERICSNFVRMDRARMRPQSSVGDVPRGERGAHLASSEPTFRKCGGRQGRKARAKIDRKIDSSSVTPVTESHDRAAKVDGRSTSTNRRASVRGAESIERSNATRKFSHFLNLTLQRRDTQRTTTDLQKAHKMIQ